jgi:hypothetical protein
MALPIDDKTSGRTLFNMTVDGEKASLGLTFHACSHKASINPFQACQPLVIFVNMPCDDTKDEQLETLNSFLNEFTKLKDPLPGDPALPTGLVTLYVSLPAKGKSAYRLAPRETLVHYTYRLESLDRH